MLRFMGTRSIIIIDKYLLIYLYFYFFFYGVNAPHR